MSILNNIKNIFIKESANEQCQCAELNIGDTCIFNSTSSYRESLSLQLSTVYRCVEVISDSVAQLPLNTFMYDADGNKHKQLDTPIYKVLNYQPNERMTRYTFLKMMVTSMLLKGAGYAYIERNVDKTIKFIHYIPYDYVSVLDYNYIKKPVYKIKGFGDIDADDMIVFMNHTIDGVRGISTIQYANLALQVATDAETVASNFLKGGGAPSAILTVQSANRFDALEGVIDKWKKVFSNGRPASGVVALPGNISYQPISVNPADALLLETRKYTVIEICRFFGVNPYKVFDTTGTSQYGSIEAANLAFLSDTLAPILIKLEQELNKKVFNNEELGCAFDTSILLRTDKASFANYYLKLFQIGAISINEFRTMLDLPPINNGDNCYVMSNLVTVDRSILIVQNEQPNNAEQQEQQEEQ